MPGQKRRTHQSKPNPRHLEWSNLVLRGHSYRQIATQYGVSHSAVYKAVRRVEELERPEHLPRSDCGSNSRSLGV